MQVHPIRDDQIERLKSIPDRNPMTAALRVGNRLAGSDDSPSDEELAALANAESPSLDFSIQAMGVRLGDVVCTRSGSEDTPVRWFMQFEASPLDRFASLSRGRDWRHGIIGAAMRAVWRAAADLSLSETSEKLAPLLRPAELAVVRIDVSKEKEKDRMRDIPLVNVTSTGGGATPIQRTTARSRRK